MSPVSPSFRPGGNKAVWGDETAGQVLGHMELEQSVEFKPIWGKETAGHVLSEMSLEELTSHLEGVLIKLIFNFFGSTDDFVEVVHLSLWFKI